MYEIRNYHFDPSQFDAYKSWVIEQALPFIKANMDLVGFWMDNVDPPEIRGSSPMDLSLGSANVTWIIRWETMDARSRFHKEVFGAADWKRIWANHPDPNGYLQMEARFADGF
jgi:hypothetical protein